jgi:Notch 1
VADEAVYVTWEDVSSISGGGSDVVFTRSTDGGVNFAAESIVDDPAAEVSSSFAPRLDVDARSAGANDDVVALVWEDRREGTQVYAATSLDGGSAFGAVKRVSSLAGSPIVGETRLPVVTAVGNGILVVAYQNRLTAANNHVFIASSIDNGTSWTLSHKQADSGGGQSLAPRITKMVQGGASGGLASWSDFRAGTRINGDIYTAGSN